MPALFEEGKPGVATTQEKIIGDRAPTSLGPLRILPLVQQAGGSLWGLSSVLSRRAGGQRLDWLAVPGRIASHGKLLPCGPVKRFLWLSMGFFAFWHFCVNPMESLSEFYGKSPAIALEFCVKTFRNIHPYQPTKPGIFKPRAYPVLARNVFQGQWSVL